MKRISADFGVLNTADIPGLTFYNHESPLPEPKTDDLDIPGRDGKLDLTGVYGRISYENREVILYFYDKSPYGAQRDANYVKLASAINGKELDVELSDAPGYKFRGRWYVDITDVTKARSQYEIVGDCYPFRLRGLFVYRINAAGGVDIVLQGGDKEKRPTFEVYHDTVINFNGETFTLRPGTWFVEDLYLQPGPNLLHIDTQPDGGNQTWQDIYDQTVTWNQFGTKRLSEWRWGDEEPQVRDRWQNLYDQSLTWADFGATPVIEWQHPADQDADTYTVYIAYEREDF